MQFKKIALALLLFTAKPMMSVGTGPTVYALMHLFAMGATGFGTFLSVSVMISPGQDTPRELLLLTAIGQAAGFCIAGKSWYDLDAWLKRKYQKEAKLNQKAPQQS